MVYLISSYNTTIAKKQTKKQEINNANDLLRWLAKKSDMKNPLLNTPIRSMIVLIILIVFIMSIIFKISLPIRITHISRVVN